LPGVSSGKFGPVVKTFSPLQTVLGAKPHCKEVFFVAVRHFPHWGRYYSPGRREESRPFVGSIKQSRCTRLGGASGAAWGPSRFPGRGGAGVYSEKKGACARQKIWPLHCGFPKKGRQTPSTRVVPASHISRPFSAEENSSARGGFAGREIGSGPAPHGVVWGNCRAGKKLGLAVLRPGLNFTPFRGP